MMRKRARESNVDVYFEGNCLLIRMSGIVKVRTIDLVMEELTIVRKRQEYTMTDLILDLSDVYSISPAAAVGLVCLCSALMTNKMEEIASPSNFYLKRPSNGVLTYLTTLGFFTQMSNKATLLGCEDLVHSESEKKQRKKQRGREKQIPVIFDNSLDNDARPIVWPMETIPTKGSSISDQDFENACQHFVNNGADTFDRLFSSSHFNFDKGDKHNFWSSNVELYMNIFEHSNSWGLATIHANPAHGTIACYHDIGIGIKGSVNFSPKAGKEFEKFETDYDAMKWSLKEGNSSKSGGNGIGLNIVEDFVLSKNGTIEIRSGQCLLQKKPGDQPGEKYWRNKNVPWFPGTQINFFVPCMTTKLR